MQQLVDEEFMQQQADDEYTQQTADERSQQVTHAEYSQHQPEDAEYSQQQPEDAEYSQQSTSESSIFGFEDHLLSSPQLQGIKPQLEKVTVGDDFFGDRQQQQQSVQGVGKQDTPADGATSEVSVCPSLLVCLLCCLWPSASLSRLLPRPCLCTLTQSHTHTLPHNACHLYLLL